MFVCERKGGGVPKWILNDAFCRGSLKSRERVSICCRPITVVPSCERVHGQPCFRRRLLPPEHPTAEGWTRSENHQRTGDTSVLRDQRSSGSDDMLH